MIAAWAAATGNAAWHLAIDTGMGRSGVRWNEVESVRDLLRTAPPAGACTHFHSADRDDDTAAHQIRRFTSALGAMPARPAIVHAENSAAIERLERPSGWTFVRPGVFLYGVASRMAPAVRSRPRASHPGERARCVVARAHCRPSDHWCGGDGELRRHVRGARAGGSRRYRWGMRMVIAAHSATRVRHSCEDTGSRS